MSTKYRTCNLCEALCGLEIEVENNQVISIKGDKEDVLSKGHICPKAVALKDLHEDPDRLKFPIKKVNGEWVKISWEEAINETAQRLFEVQQKNDTNAIGIYQGNPSIHNLGTSLFSPNFIRSLKTKNRFSATSVDQLAHHLAAEYMFGHPNLIPIPDIDRTDFWVIMGGNPMVSNGSLMTAPNVSQRLKNIQKRGGKVIVIDPRRTETADKADQHIFVKPGTDIWLILAMINIVFEKEKINLSHCENLISKEQLEEIKSSIQQFTPELAVQKTGISLSEIHQLADDYMNAKSAAWYGRLGVSATEFGGLCHWAINTLNILTGNFDQAGGAMWSQPLINTSRKNRTKRFGRWKSRVRKLPEYGGELPSNTLAEEILAEGEGQIKAMITSCGNPVLSVPNGQKLDEAFESLDFMLSIDIYLNETTRHADIILPPATGLETPHYGLGFHALAVHDSAKFSDPAVEKEEGTKFDWEIFLALQKAYEKLTLTAEEFDAKSGYFNLTLEMMMEGLLMKSSKPMSLKELKQHKHGIDLGDLKTQLPDILLTDDHKINLFPEIYKDDLNRLLNKEDNKEGLLLIGRRQLRSNNSWLHNSYRMVKGRERCTMMIHPNDAANHEIENGEEVEVTSRVGQVKIKAEITDEVGVGTISIPHGWGHHRKGIRMSVAADHAGVSMNDLADELLVDEMSGVAVINGIPVTVKKIINL